MYYGATGIRYSIGRVPMNSCDFSLTSYSFDDNFGISDKKLKNFDVKAAVDVRNGAIPSSEGTEFVSDHSRSRENGSTGRDSGAVQIFLQLRWLSFQNILAFFLPQKYDLKFRTGVRRGSDIILHRRHDSSYSRRPEDHRCMERGFSRTFRLSLVSSQVDEAE